MQSQSRQLDDLSGLLRQSLLQPIRPRSSSPKTAILCLPCGSEVPAGEECCPGCGNAVRNLTELARDELGLGLNPPPGRFRQPGWELLGLCPVDCPNCHTPTHCAIKPYRAGNGVQKYWTLLCSGCGGLHSVGELWREQRDALRAWARQQPVLERDKPELSETLSETLELLRSGHQPEEIARVRGLAASTVQGHLVSLVRSGHLPLEELLSPEVIRSVEEAHARFPRPVDLADLEARLPLPLLRSDLNLVVQARELQMGLGDPVDEDSRERVRGAMRAAVTSYRGQLGPRELVGIGLGTEGYRSGPFAHRLHFRALRGFAQEALEQELRCLLQEGGLSQDERGKLTL